ncbi:MAG: hydrogenase maturation protease [Chloroflexota bacterium]
MGSRSPGPGSPHPPILVIGLGNPILGDDGLGWRVAEVVQQALTSQASDFVEFDFLSLGGLSLMERLVDYERVVLIDAMNSGQNPVGTVKVFPLEQLPAQAYGHLSSAHDTSLQNALQVGRRLGARLPDQIVVVAVESPYVYDFSETLTPPVASALPEAAQAVITVLRQWTPNLHSQDFSETRYDIP